MASKFWSRMLLLYGVLSTLAVVAVYIRWQTLSGQGLYYAFGAVLIFFFSLLVLDKNLISRIAGGIIVCIGGLFLYMTLFPLDWDPGIQHRIDFWENEQQARRALAKSFREGKYYHL